MELMQNVAKMQNSQTQQPSNSVQMQQHQTEAIQKAEINQEKLVQNNAQDGKKIDSEKDMESLVKELNESISPFRTSLRFGFDNTSEDFYVSVIESQSNRVISRFPAEKAAEFLPKIQEVNGFLFDKKG